MKRAISYIFYVFFLILFISACNTNASSGFWTTFNKNNLKYNNNNQGPWGGRIELHWKSDKKNSFISSQLIVVAAEKGWVFVDSVSFPADILKKWRKWDTKEPTFPFTYTDFNGKEIYSSTFQRWIISDLKLFRFKTNRIIVEPGNQRETDVNGYVLLNSDGTEMSVYHIWGE